MTEQNPPPTAQTQQDQNRPGESTSSQTSSSRSHEPARKSLFGSALYTGAKVAGGGVLVGTAGVILAPIAFGFYLFAQSTKYAFEHPKKTVAAVLGAGTLGYALMHADLSAQYNKLLTPSPPTPPSVLEERISALTQDNARLEDVSRIYAATLRDIVQQETSYQVGIEPKSSSHSSSSPSSIPSQTPSPVGVHAATAKPEVTAAPPGAKSLDHQLYVLPSVPLREHMQTAYSLLPNFGTFTSGIALGIGGTLLFGLGISCVNYYRRHTQKDSAMHALPRAPDAIMYGQQTTPRTTQRTTPLTTQRNISTRERTLDQHVQYRSRARAREL